MDDERLKNLSGGGYWKELLQRIRDIRASEKVFYRQVIDINSTSIKPSESGFKEVLLYTNNVKVEIYCKMKPSGLRRKK